MSSMKSANSMTPLPSLSTYAIIFLISSFLGSKPKALMATLSYLESMYPGIRQTITNWLGVEQVESFLYLLLLFLSQLISGISGWLQRSFFFFESWHLNFKIYLNLSIIKLLLSSIDLLISNSKQNWFETNNHMPKIGKVFALKACDLI